MKGTRIQLSERCPSIALASCLLLFGCSQAPPDTTKDPASSQDPVATAPPEPSKQQARARVAVVTTLVGRSTRVLDFRTRYADSCGGFIEYVGISTNTETLWDFLSLDTGPYTVDVPFQIIERVEVTQVPHDFEKTRKQARLTVLLGDKTVISGRQWLGFSGNSDLQTS